ncbi:hypothetical protein YWS52_00100 [Chitiniphilus shinanonensis]
MGGGKLGTTGERGFHAVAEMGRHAPLARRVARQGQAEQDQQRQATEQDGHGLHDSHARAVPAIPPHKKKPGTWPGFFLQRKAARRAVNKTQRSGPGKKRETS